MNFKKKTLLKFSKKNLVIFSIWVPQFELILFDLHISSRTSAFVYLWNRILGLKTVVLQRPTGTYSGPCHVRRVGRAHLFPWHGVHSLQSAVVEAFTPWKLANAVNQNFSPRQLVVKHLENNSGHKTQLFQNQSKCQNIKLTNIQNYRNNMTNIVVETFHSRNLHKIALGALYNFCNIHCMTILRANP